MADLAPRAVRRLAVGRRRVRDVLRVHRRREQPVRARAVRGHHPGRATGHRGGGLPPHRGPHRADGELDPPAEGADAGPPVLRLPRARRDARSPPRAQGVGRQVQGAVRRRLGRPARAHLRPPAGAGRRPRRCGADPSQPADLGLGRHARRPQAGSRPPDGGLRGLPRAHGPPRRHGDRRDRGPRHPRQHADLPDHRRQRRVGRGHDERRVQRDGQLQRDGRARDARVHAQQAGRARLAQLVQPLLGRLGVGHGHAVPVDQAGGLPLGWDAQRHDRALAGRDRGTGRAPVAVHPRHRRRPDRSSRPPACRSRRA